jgi:hypothetical protein
VQAHESFQQLAAGRVAGRAKGDTVGHGQQQFIARADFGVRPETGLLHHPPAGEQRILLMAGHAADVAGPGDAVVQPAGVLRGFRRVVPR